MNNKSKQLWLGALETLPLVVAAFPFGIVFGALAQSIGLTFGIAVGMSVIVYADSGLWRCTAGEQATGATMEIWPDVVCRCRHDRP